MLRGALASVLLIGALGACGGDPEPKVQDDPTPSGTPTNTTASADPTSSSPTPTGPEEPMLPAAARENSDAGAEAFVRWWVELVNYAQATGNTTTLKSLNDTRCEGCDGLVRAIDNPYAQGGHIEGGTFAIGRLRKLPLDHGADWAGFAKGQVDPQTVVDAQGGEETSTGSEIYLYSYLAWVDDRWSMRWFRAGVPS